jgi:hypothetical protein
VLYFVYEELALGYLLFSFLSALGVLQWVAARYRLAGLAFLNYAQRRTWGYALGTFLIAGSTIWFFGSQWAKILTPGPAGSELSLLFGAGAVSALAVTITVASLLQRLRKGAPPQGRADRSQTVAVGRATTGRLYLPPDPTAPMPAVCLVPGLGVGEESMDILARHLVEQRLVALVIAPDDEFASYPETLAILPAATSLLSKRPDVDPHRLGALGYDLGGDLVIRAASADKQLKAVAALAPVLGDPPVGLDLMSEMPFAQALRWARDRTRAKLQMGLNAFEYRTKIAPRPFLLLYGTEDRLVTRSPLQVWDAPEKPWITHQVIQGAGHLDLLDHPTTLHTVARWLKEHL